MKLAVIASSSREALRGFLDEDQGSLTVQAFRSLVDESGVADAIAAIKPYKNRNAYILVCMVKKRLGLKGPGIEALITPMSLAQAGICGKENVRQEIKERGAVCYANKCLFRDAPPEFCVVVSHYTTDLICEALNPEYECIWTHHLTNGDPFDRYVYRKKGEAYADINDLGETIMSIPMMDLPKEEERALRDYVLMNVLDAVIEGWVDQHGSEKTLDVLVPLAKRVGMERGNFFAKEYPRMKNDVTEIGQLIDILGQVSMQRGAVQDISKDEMRKEITDCPFQVHPYEMCKLQEAMMQGIVQSLDPDLTYSYARMMRKGDKVCCWHLKNRNADPQVVLVDEFEGTEGPLDVLKMRLAKGEISKEEYEELKIIVTS